jgi:hypothetical protein
MNKGIKLTATLLIGTVLAFPLYDIWVGYNYGANATISMVVWYSSMKYPFIPFMSGFLAGHIFSQMDTTKKNPLDGEPSAR